MDVFSVLTEVYNISREKNLSTLLEINVLLILYLFMFWSWLMQLVKTGSNCVEFLWMAIQSISLAIHFKSNSNSTSCMQIKFKFTVIQFRFFPTLQQTPFKCVLLLLLTASCFCNSVFDGFCNHLSVCVGSQCVDKLYAGVPDVSVPLNVFSSWGS